MSGSPAIELHQLRHSYGDQEVLRGIDLTIDSGEIFGFLGHNGAGKTTTVSILTTLLVPTSGTAIVAGHDVVGAREEVTRNIGYVPADVRLYGHLTARENLMFFGRLSGVDSLDRAVRETLSFLDASDYADQRVTTFSTGMRQRIGIAQAILHRPRILFLDEPTSGLDPVGVRRLRETILQLNGDLGMTVFMNTHLLSEVGQVCTTIGVLNRGILLYKDSIGATMAEFPDAQSLEDVYVSMDGAS